MKRLERTKVGSVAIALGLFAMAAPAFAENDLPADHFSYALPKVSQWYSACCKTKIVMGDAAPTFQTGDAPVLVPDQREQQAQQTQSQ